ncbi:MAG: hypothetical protein U0559_09775 [Anaerolineae bacterium]
MKRLTWLLIALMLAGAVLTACGGNSSGDPVSVVKELMNVVQAKNFDAISNYACAAMKDQITQTFNPVGSLAGSGVDAKKALDAMTITLADMTYEKTSETADKAAVQVKGKFTIKIDRDKLKAFLVDLFKAQGTGIEPTDDMINQALDAAAAQFEQGQDVNSTMNLIKENGKWVVCE